MSGPLPPGYTCLIDHASGRPIYINHNTKTTSWTDPRNPPRAHPLGNVIPEGGGLFGAAATTTAAPAGGLFGIPQSQPPLANARCRYASSRGQCTTPTNLGDRTGFCKYHQCKNIQFGLCNKPKSSRKTYCVTCEQNSIVGESTTTSFQPPPPQQSEPPQPSVPPCSAVDDGEEDVECT